MSRRLLFRLLASTSAGDHVADAELLRRFVAQQDSAALELVVRRHAGAVWAVCRRVLNEADAEDAFQATFLALLQHAGAVRTSCAGGWLHRVAVHAALKLRERAARTRPLELARLDTLAAAAVEPADTDLAASVHEELARLPERERLPVVLCDLEGLSHADAARELGWPVGTVSGRLSRARAKLRARLERRGLSLPAAVLAVGVAPPHLIPKALSANAATISPVILALSEGAVAMLKTKTWSVVAGVAAIGVAVAGLGVAVGLAQPGAGPKKGSPVPEVLKPQWKAPPADEKWFKDNPPPSAFPELVVPEPGPDSLDRVAERQAALTKLCPRLNGTIALEIEPTDGMLQKLLKARLHQCVREHILTRRTLDSPGPEGLDFNRAYELIDDLQVTVAELWPGPSKERILWLSELLVVAKEWERYVRMRVEVGAVKPTQLYQAASHRLKVEAEMWKAKNPK